MAAGRLTREALLKIVTDDGDAEKKLDEIAAKADELRLKHPELKITIDKAEASAKLRLFKLQLDAATRDKTVNIEVKTSKIRDALLGLRKLIGSWKGGSSGGGGGGFLGNLASLFSGGLTNPAGIAAITASIAALLPELAGLVSGLAAATAGLGAFGLLAIPTFHKVANAYTAISTAQQKYNAALALEKEFPTTAHAKAATTALQQLRVAQENMAPSTRRAVAGIQSLVNTFHKMATAFEPTVLKVFNAGLKVANDLLPALGPLANAAGGALGGLLKQVDGFARSKGFQDWLKQFGKLVGPSITAIGQGIGKVTVAIGLLFTRMSAHDVVHTINILFDTLAITIRVLGATVVFLMRTWDIATSRLASGARRVGGAFAEGWKNVIKWTREANAVVTRVFVAIGGAAGRLIAVLRGWWNRAGADIGHWVNVVRGWIDRVIAFFRQVPARVRGALSSLPGTLFRIGVAALEGLLHGIESMVGGVLGRIRSLAGDIGGAFASVLHIFSPSRVFREHGRNIVRGLILGIDEQGPAALATIRRLSAQVGAGGAAAAGAARTGRAGQLQFSFAQGGGTPLEQMFWSWFRKNIRIKGGDPNVLGR